MATETDRKAALRQAAAIADELATRAAERKFHDFIRLAWPVMKPREPFADNWHIGALAEHLQAVEEGQIKNLLINEPPGMMKTLEANVFFNAWCWTRDAGKRFLCASHDQTLATRDNIDVRDLVTSEWFRARWPGVMLRDDQNQKTRFDTTAGGWRIGTSVDGRGVGEHPHGKIVDDAHKPTAVTPLDMETVWRWFTQTFGLRGQILQAWTIVIGQRVKEDDISGRVHDAGGFVEIVLPMRWEPHRMVTTPLGWNDPRTVPGELLWPAKHPDADVTAVEKNKLGPWGTAAQHQQRPAPIGGALFRRTQFQIVAALPVDDEIAAAVRFWDMAATEGGTGARTSGVRMVRTDAGRFIVTHVRKGRWSPPEAHANILSTAKTDGVGTLVREEEEGGSSGKTVVATRTIALAGYDYRGVRASDGKVARANPLLIQVEAGNVAILQRPPRKGETESPDAEWVREFLDEIELFPFGALKDQVDAAAGALNVLALERPEPSLDEGAMFPLFH